MFTPCTIPSGDVSGLIPAATEVEVPGTFQKIQCVTSIEFFMGAASVSCMITAKLTAPLGGFVQDSAGEAAFGSAHEYCVGIIDPSEYADDINLNLEGGGAGAAGCCAATPAAIPTDKMDIAMSDCINLIRIVLPP